MVINAIHLTKNDKITLTQQVYNGPNNDLKSTGRLFTELNIEDGILFYNADSHKTDKFVRELNNDFPVWAEIKGKEYQVTLIPNGVNPYPEF